MNDPMSDSLLLRLVIDAAGARIARRDEGRAHPTAAERGAWIRRRNDPNP